ncbi:MAG: transposase [Planctomycetes bacterium]|nr:transposase [Planctomycetota bacterium]
MDDDTRQTAYFRFGIIGPLLMLDPGATLKHGLETQANRTWTQPDGQLCVYAPSTIEGWVYRYRHGGLDALIDAPRRDKGTFPGMPEQVCDEALRLFHEHPAVRTSTVYDHLTKSGLIVDGRPSRSTFYRWTSHNRPECPSPVPQERRAFEAGWSAALWQADIMYGPLIRRKQRDGRHRQAQTYLVAIIDDHSRLLCEGRFFFRQSMDVWLETLRAACCRRGIPEKLYVDNGKVFISPQITRIGAVLGMRVLRTGVRDAAAKGKIERFFRTVRTRFLDALELEGLPQNLDALNRAFRVWTETHYNGAVHSAHSLTPMQRWIDGASRLRTIDVDEADELFLFETHRKVKKDGTFSLSAKRFETDSSLAGKQVLVRYDPTTLNRVDVWFEQQFRGRANELDLRGNDGLIRDKGTSA